MTEGYDAEFVSDLARLMSKYGPEPFERLARAFKDPEEARRLGDLLNSVAASRPRRRKAPSSDRMRTAPRGESVLRELRNSSIELHNAILVFRDDFVAGEILPTMRDVRNFAQLNRVSIGRASSRNAALVPLLRSLSSFSPSEVRELHGESLQSSGKLGTQRTLGHLRDAIIGSRTGVSADESDSNM